MPLKILIIDNDSRIRSTQVQDDENNDSGEQIFVPLSLERQRNESKNSLAKKKQESEMTAE